MTPALDRLILLAWSQLWQVTLVALVAGGAARLLGRHRPRLAYALWMLVVIKALVPPVISSPAGVFSWVPAAEVREGSRDAPAFATPAQPATGGERRITVPARTAPAEASTGTSPALPISRGYVLMLLAVIWSLGLAASLIFVARKWLLCHRHIGRTSRIAGSPLAEQAASMAARLGVRRRVHLLVTESLFGPAAFGLLRPTVLLPGPLLRNLGPEQLDLILAHELVHIRRWDALMSRLQVAVQAIWWFHPLIWWANREASRERERCCDEEVVAGLGCDPARYARGLLDVLERKRRLQPLFALPGMRPLEITTHRLEHIMRYRPSRGRHARLLSWFIFTAGAILLIPGAGMQPQVPQTGPAKEEWAKAVRWWDSHVAWDPAGKVWDTWSKQMDYQKNLSQVVNAQATPGQVEGGDTVTLKGVVRDKATGRPLAGIQVSGGGEDGTESVTTKSAADGRFELLGLPARERYTMVVGCMSGEPYLLTSRVVEMKKGEPPPPADVELVRGIPFRVRILDVATGKPIRGGISYFPLYPNNPIARGVLGYTAGGGWVAGAFYETSLNGEGEYRGAVLPGKGVLCFQPAGGKWEWKKGERELALFSPDGPDVIKVEGMNGPGPFVHGNPMSRSNPPAWGGLGLIHYPAVIAINPKEETKEIDYEFKIPNPDPPAKQ